MSAKKVRKRRDSNQIFMDKLKDLSGNNQRAVSNKNLREALGWDENRYNATKTSLINDGVISSGRGQGGSVTAVCKNKNKKLNVFVSYSHIDSALKKKLINHLEPIKKLGHINIWHDDEIKAGNPIDVGIRESMKIADVILILISIDFINSDYCYGVELEAALSREEDGTSLVVPIILRNCMWHCSPFGRLKALPEDGKAVKSWDNEDDAFTNIANKLKESMEAFREKKYGSEG